MQALRVLLLIPLLPVLIITIIADGLGYIGCVTAPQRSPGFTRSLLDAVLGTTQS